jgi:pimeloyl-ACP methyl ester carboxylesterase
MFAAKIPKNEDERADMTVAIARAIASGADPFDEVAGRALEARLQARARNPGAAMNHMLAIGASPDRTEALAQIAVPTLVIHGSDDLSVPIEHGRATAAAIPDAALLVIEGMGHAIPIFARQRLVEAILKHTAAAA